MSKPQEHQPAPSPASTTPWHTLTAEAVANALEVAPATGLSGTEAASRRARHGPNALPEGKQRGPWRIFLSQFSDVMILLLLAAAAISMALGEFQDALAIAVIVTLNAAIGFFQESRTERAIEALRSMATPSARVRRIAELHGGTLNIGSPDSGTGVSPRVHLHLPLAAGTRTGP